MKTLASPRTDPRPVLHSRPPVSSAEGWRSKSDPRSVSGSRHAGTTWSPSCWSMWSGKMATRWRRKDGHLKPGKAHFLPHNNPHEFNLNGEVEMDTHSTVDHSILAIFEDSSTFSEDKADAEDSDKLLSAFTEMLESVEDDEDTLFPFKTLPEPSLLMSQDTTKESSLSETHDMSPNEELSNNKVDAEVEVFTSASLVNLVKLMHSYCLKLQVEEEPGKSSKNSTVFSKEEVWKYERPTEDNDEEINVVSDDEESVEVEMKTRDNTNKPLKSALLNGSPSKKEKKRVSFGAVQVTSYDMDSQTKACSAANDTPEGTVSSENDQMTDISPQKSEGKRKPLSLQQYRQLRQKRQPLVEKQGNYTTKWPSVSVPPKELTPILGAHGQKQTCFKPAATHNSLDATKTLSNVHSMKTKASSDLPHKAKRPRLNGKIQLVADHSNPLVQVNRKSPTKKSLIVNSDPPNPVLVPLPLQHPSPENTQQLTEETSITEDNSAAKSNNQSPILAEQQKCLPNCRLDLTKQSSVTSLNSPSLPYEPPTPVTTPVKEMMPETAFRLPPPSEGLPVSSGIEASDLTSLLEQFEETQAKEGERAPQINSKHSSKLDCAAPNSILRTIPVCSPDPAPLVSCTEELLSTSIPTPLADFGLDLKIPEPLVTEVILSSSQDNTVRRKVPPVKAIQIIEPRPLPAKRAHAGLLEPSFTPAHVFLAISSDHDYCTVVDSNKTSNSYTSEAAQTNPIAAVSCSKQMSEVDTNPSKNGTQDEQTKLPVVSPPLITDSGKKTNSEIGLDTYMIPPTPPPSPPCKGGDRTSPPHRGRDRERRMYSRRSHSSDSSSNSSSCSSSASSSSSSSSRSGSRSPKRQRRHSSNSSSCSSSTSRSASPSPSRQHQENYFSRSRSTSWSQSRSRSRSRSRSLSPTQRVERRRWTDVNRESRKLRREQEVRVQKLRAIDERRVVYVGRIRRSMTHEELRDRFSQFGDVESVSLHFRDRGDHYGFVTFYNMDDAFSAIDNGGKLRRPDELPFDICFGGRRQFCNSDYADLDANRDADRSPVRSRFQGADFDLLLKQAQKGLKR